MGRSGGEGLKKEGFIVEVEVGGSPRCFFLPRSAVRTKNVLQTRVEVLIVLWLEMKKSLDILHIEIRRPHAILRCFPSTLSDYDLISAFLGGRHSLPICLTHTR